MNRKTNTEINEKADRKTSSETGWKISPEINEETDRKTSGETDGKAVETMDGKKSAGLWAQIKKCPVFLLLCVSGMALTLMGAAGKNSIYKDYSFNGWTMPYLSLVMRGLEDGVPPLDASACRESLETAGRMLTRNTGGGKAKDAIVIPLLEQDRTASNESAGNGPEGRAEGSGGNGNGAADRINVPEDEAGIAAKTGVTDNGGDEAARSVSGNGSPLSFISVTEDYFDDAVFIGDSRTQGLYEYGGLEERADFFSKISLTIYNVLTEPFIKDAETGKKITVEEALSKKQYGKVYLMLGINELGTGTTESFMEEYRKVVTRIRELQPDAVLFVEAIMRVTGSKDESDPIFNNTNINDKNSEIAKLADGQNIFYLDVNEVVCNSEGNLNDEYTVDEVHLKAQYYSIWKDFLLKHGIVR